MSQSTPGRSLRAVPIQYVIYSILLAGLILLTAFVLRRRAGKTGASSPGSTCTSLAGGSDHGSVRSRGRRPPNPL